MIPNAICGDLDSLKQHVRNYYENKHVCVIHCADQDSNDLEKCIDYIDTSTEINDDEHCIIVFGGGGRLDQEMCNLNLLYKQMNTRPQRRVMLMSQFSVSFMLKANVKHVIKRNTAWECKTCAFIPIGEPCGRIYTEGLKWNLDLGPNDAHKLRFGDIVSTSNEFLDGNEVVVVSSSPLLWITNLNQAEVQ